MDWNRENRRQRMIENNLKERDRESLLAIMGTKEGRWFFTRLMEYCRLYQAILLDARDTNLLILQEGERRVALALKDRIIEHLGEEGFLGIQLAERERREWERDMEALLEKEGKGEDEYLDI
ncbi:hypothetical protein TAMA11512_12940 [Selenomonas sp. TAMA-11512]|uniref:hypothetical protein n=1 Tax=Selenomonas sp. TAMA-11512 TaxID=3095337 RepID=UPI003086FECF|nr:hypothetical protein TAMA11512_12940 [Selenomonas sp. TAMA-11512]